MKKEDLHSIIQEEIKNHMIEEGIMSWLLDKAENFAKSAIKHKTDYQYARIYNDPGFKKLSKKFNMGEDEFVKKAKQMIKSNPKKFEDLLAYDVSKSPNKKLFGF